MADFFGLDHVQIVGDANQPNLRHSRQRKSGFRILVVDIPCGDQTRERAIPSVPGVAAASAVCTDCVPGHFDKGQIPGLRDALAFLHRIKGLLDADYIAQLVCVVQCARAGKRVANASWLTRCPRITTVIQFWIAIDCTSGWATFRRQASWQREYARLAPGPIAPAIHKRRGSKHPQ